MRTWGPYRYLATMFRSPSPVAAFAVAAALTLGGCEWPTHNPAKLKEIRTEAHALMKAHPGQADIPPEQWPRAIAALEPEFVRIGPQGVHITTRAYFDGGWGYFVPTPRRGYVHEPGGRYKEVGRGIYWWHPY